MNKYLHILIVEDDIRLQYSLTRLLLRFSPNSVVSWVTTGDEVFEKIWGNTSSQYRRIDLVITDILLPGGYSGLQIWRRCNNSRPRVPCIMMSGMGIDEYFLAVKNDSVMPLYLPKPFSALEFMRTLEKTLNHEQSGDEAA
ncbi:MAG: response regulator [Deltaproteobacteria bacterium]|nr:response regulator [Deltaproteobacteria bacterium]